MSANRGATPRGPARGGATVTVRAVAPKMRRSRMARPSALVVPNGVICRASRGRATSGRAVVVGSRTAVTGISWGVGSGGIGGRSGPGGDTDAHVAPRCGEFDGVDDVVDGDLGPDEVVGLEGAGADERRDLLEVLEAARGGAHHGPLVVVDVVGRDLQGGALTAEAGEDADPGSGGQDAEVGVQGVGAADGH